MIQRSRLAGRARDVIKKCDETRPVCGRCTQAGRACEGYKTRLVWGPSGITSPKTGIVLNPVRQSRTRRISRSSRVADVLLSDSLDLSATLSDLHQVPSPDQLDILYLQHGSDGQAEAENLLSDDVSALLHTENGTVRAEWYRDIICGTT
ncbi:hypothetical protein N7491_008467 [Penicillium cf. griseofulvum]|nr:hypothetical protein N7491_008467 [Penicillium cf. griseofulvum]